MAKTKNIRSKYRFSQIKSYVDNNGIRYSYDYKYMGLFHFFVINADYRYASFTEEQLDLINIQIDN
jgi:hypothetical protein